MADGGIDGSDITLGRKLSPARFTFCCRSKNVDVPRMDADSEICRIIIAAAQNTMFSGSL